MTHTTITTKSVKIGHHRGKRRIWLQGQSLTSAGWCRGTTFRVGWGGGGCVLRRGSTDFQTTTDDWDWEPAERRVSGKGTAPIVDICCAKCALAFAACDRASVTIGSDLIILAGLKP